ncbi:MAG: GIY-YIG nuclease family protein [Gammaproteobacteria bacterium]
MRWFVYMILCSDDSLYTGISNDVLRRYRQHADKQGAKYFRGRSPQCLIYVESGHDRSSATKREVAIKKMSRDRKLLLVESILNEADRFSC